MMDVTDFQIALFADFGLVREDTAVAGGPAGYGTGDLMAPAEAAIVVNAFAHQPENFARRAEMDEFGGGQLEELHAVGVEGGPDGFAGDGQFIAEFAFRRLALKGFQR
jgi:hypothetical protein